MHSCLFADYLSLCLASSFAGGRECLPPPPLCLSLRTRHGMDCSRRENSSIIYNCLREALFAHTSHTASAFITNRKKKDRRKRMRTNIIDRKEKRRQGRTGRQRDWFAGKESRKRRKTTWRRKLYSAARLQAPPHRSPHFTQASYCILLHMPSLSLPQHSCAW